MKHGGSSLLASEAHFYWRKHIEFHLYAPLRLLVNVACDASAKQNPHPTTPTDRASCSGDGLVFSDWFVKQVMQDHATQLRISRDGSWRKVRNA